MIAIPVLQLGDLPKDDPKRADILETRKAGHAAIALLPELSVRMRWRRVPARLLCCWLSTTSLACTRW